jgi:hypothetical protein
VNLIRTKSVVCAFINKLLLYKQNLGKGEFSQFPNLLGSEKKDKEVISYCEHLYALHSEINRKFNILNMEIPN